MTTDIENTEEEMSYADMYASILMSGEVTFTIPAEDEEKVKTGIKNCKAKQATKDKEEGLVPDRSILEFTKKDSEEFLGAIDLTVSAIQRGTTKVLKVTIPEKF